jgi:hypothetical protein
MQQEQKRRRRRREMRDAQTDFFVRGCRRRESEHKKEKPLRREEGWVAWQRGAQAAFSPVPVGSRELLRTDANDE